MSRRPGLSVTRSCQWLGLDRLGYAAHAEGVLAARMWIAALVACGSPAGPSVSLPDPDPRAMPACTLPSGVVLRDLEPRERGLVLRRIFACNDFRRGRITQADYASAIAAIDAEWSKLDAHSATPTRPTVWASSVRGFSSEYGTPSWAATQVLGPPNVFPRHGDIQQAWASRGADDRDEWIEVGFGHARSIAAVIVYETYNPGAISRVTLSADDGATFDLPIGTAVAETSTEGSVLRRFDLPCTPYRVRTVRLELDSKNVPGWNEIDAIGVVPCGPILPGP